MVGAYGEMYDDVYVIAEAVAKELATEHCGFYSDKKQGEVAAFFLSQLYRSWGLVAHSGWARLMLDRKCLVEVPNAPRHRAERAHAEAEYDEETAFDNYLTFDFCLGTSIPVLTTSTYAVAWSQGDQYLGGAHGTRRFSPQPNCFRFRFIPRKVPGG